MEIKRVPIKRVPIKIPTKADVYEEKLKSMGATYQQKAIMAVAKHYEMMVCKFNRITGFRALSVKNPDEHRNWKLFKKLLEVCKEKGWDVNLYIEVQFDKAKKYWTNPKIKYPLPNMLYGQKAQEYFERYLEDRKEKYQFDVSGKEKIKGKKTVSVKTRVIQEVIRSAEYVSMYVREDVDEAERAEDKAVRIYHSWETYSPAYLYSIPWFRDYVKELNHVKDTDKKLENLLLEFDMIDRSKALQEVISKTVKMAEKEFNVPDNIAI